MMRDEPIPIANPGAEFRALEADLSTAVTRVLKSGQYILGKEVRRFEVAFARFLDAEHCIGVASGTDALSIALLAVGVTEGDEVITVSHSAVATVAAIEKIRAIPVFVDIDPETRCMDPERINGMIGPKTKVVLPVHIYGQPAPMRQILSIAHENGLKVVEDCAQAHGAEIQGKKVGTFGEAAAFSFYPTKNLGGFGDGGAVVTSRSEVNEKARLIREYGWKERYISLFPGTNSRLDEIQAAVLNEKLPHLSKFNAKRRDIAGRYREAMEGSDMNPPAEIKGTLHAMHLFVVECENRDALDRFLSEGGIGTGRHYPLAIHRQPAYIKRIRGSRNLPCTENLYARMLSLPMFPELTDVQIERVCSALKEWKGKKP